MYLEIQRTLSNSDKIRQYIRTMLRHLQHCPIYVLPDIAFFVYYIIRYILCYINTIVMISNILQEAFCPNNWRNNAREKFSCACFIESNFSPLLNFDETEFIGFTTYDIQDEIAPPDEILEGQHQLQNVDIASVSRDISTLRLHFSY